MAGWASYFVSHEANEFIIIGIAKAVPSEVILIQRLADLAARAKKLAEPACAPMTCVPAFWAAL